MPSVVNKTINSAVVQSRAIDLVVKQTGSVNNTTYRTLGDRLG